MFSFKKHGRKSILFTERKGQPIKDPKLATTSKITDQKLYMILNEEITR